LKSVFLTMYSHFCMDSPPPIPPGIFLAPFGLYHTRFPDGGNKILKTRKLNRRGPRDYRIPKSKHQSREARDQIIMNLQYTKIPKLNFFGLEFGIYLVPRFAGLDIGIWDLFFFSACSAVKVPARF
jgi:hypothetical protein